MVYIRNAFVHVLILVFMVATVSDAANKTPRRVFFVETDAVNPAAVQNPVTLNAKQPNRADFSSAVPYADLTDVQMKESERFTRLSIPGMRGKGEPGMPEIPSREELVRVPAGAKIRLVIDNVSWQDVEGEVLLPPVQPPYPDVRPLGGDKKDPPIPFTKNTAVYSQNGFQNSDPVILGDRIRIRGREYIKIIYRPVDFNPVEKKVRVAHDVQWHLDVSAPNDVERRRFDRFNTAPTDAIDIRTQEQIDAEIPSTDHSDSTSGPAPDLVASQNDADYLIITPDEFADEVAPLAAWKHKKGYKTYVATLTETGSSDDAIKTYIQNAYDNGTPTTYVLLIGDHEDLPAYEIIGHPYHTGGSDPVTGHVWHVDFPYSLVDGGDVYPDLYVARLPGETSAQVTHMVDAALAYDRTPDAGSWYDDVLVAGQFQDSDDSNMVADRMFMEDLHQIADFLGPDYDFYGSWNGRSEVNKGFTVHTALQWDTSTTSNLQYGGWAYDARLTPPTPVPDVWKDMGSGNATQISSAINSGVSMVFHRDHGYSGESSGGEGWADPNYQASHVNGLVNANKVPFVFSLNCATGWFDGCDKFAESWMRNSNGGAIGYTGAARVSYSGYNDCFHVGIMDSFWDDYSTYDDGVTIPYPNSWRPAEAIVRAKGFIFADYGTGGTALLSARLFNWFGEPELQLRTETPVALSATHTAGLSAGVADDVTINVTRGGSDCEGALVALVMDSGSVYATGTTDANGDVTLNVTPLATGTMTVTASEQNSTPYEGTITVVSGSDPVISVNPASLNQSASMGSNAVAQAFTIQNVGVGTVNYSISDDAAWLSCSPSSGSTTGELDTITVTYDTALLAPAVYNATITITDSGAINSPVSIPVQLTVSWPPPETIYEANMDSNPGWTLQGDWAYGQPSGGGGEYGNPDPTSGYTGDNVIGYNLAGDYANSLAETFATTPSIDCSSHTNVSLSFYRYLNVEDATYDHAYLRVSNDGSDWTELFANSDAANTEDSAWSEQTYDISDVADGQSTVYIRWVMGTTDDSWQFSGWNIDDLQVTGNVLADPPAVAAPSDLSATAVATNQIDLSWTDNSDNETGFVIERSESSGSGFSTLATLPADSTSYSDTGLPMGATYFYQVYATNGTDTSAMSSETSATTLKYQAMVTLTNLLQPYTGLSRPVGYTTDPEGLTVVVTYGGDTNPPVNAGSYAVVATIDEPSYEGTTNGTLVVSQATPTVNSWPTAGAISAGDALSAATLSGGDASVAGSFAYDTPATIPPVGAYTADVTFTPASANYESVGGTVSVDVAPAAPTGLAGTPSVGTVDLIWDSASGASSYNVKRAAESGGSYTIIGSPLGESYSDTTVTNGETYYYVVSAVGTGGEGPDSGELTVGLLQALPFTESFDGVGMASAIGMVDGQNGWTGGSNALVQAGESHGGVNALSIAEDSASLDVLNGSNVVAVSFWIKPVAGAEPEPASLSSNSTAVIWVGTNQHVMVYSNTTAVTLPATVVPDQWCHMEANINYAAGTWDLAIDGTNAATGLGVYSNKPGFIGIEFDNTSPTATYVDDLSITSVLAALSDYENWLVDHYGDAGIDDSLIVSNGVNTIREAYVIGLDPDDPAGRFTVTGIGSQSGNTVLNWGGVSGRLYNVYWSSNLFEGAAGFHLLYSNVPWNASSVTDSVHNADNAGFYRIDVQLDE
jgi:hypothetical protein